MPAISSFTFSGFTLRPSRGIADLRLASAWTEADPHHCNTTQGVFWCEQDLGTESYLLEDKFGPVFFFKMQRAPNNTIELHIQFPPDRKDASAQADQRAHVMTGLQLGLQWIERVLSLRGVRALCFTSKSPSLMRFCVKRLGFTRDGERLEKSIPSPNAILN